MERYAVHGMMCEKKIEEFKEFLVENNLQ